MRISDWSSDVCSSDLKHVAQSTGDGRGNGRRLEHYSVTKGQSRGNFPGGDRNGEVPGRDQPQGTERVTPCGRLHAHAHRTHVTTVNAYCLASEEAERSEERSVGKGGCSRCRSRWGQYP